jgi:hypothetical protein
MIIEDERIIKIGLTSGEPFEETLPLSGGRVLRMTVETAAGSADEPGEQATDKIVGVVIITDTEPLPPQEPEQESEPETETEPETESETESEPETGYEPPMTPSAGGRPRYSDV